MKRSTVAVIDEARCIGCTLCIAACPVDAIVGARAFMHTVIESYCIGCDLCVPPCPVDCIEIVHARLPWTDEDAAAAKRRARSRKARLRTQSTIELARPGERRAAVDAAIERARLKRAAKNGGTA
jgi:Na+-translocating ferredoxin:NAD+ oxidoreductase subunit B